MSILNKYEDLIDEYGDCLTPGNLITKQEYESIKSDLFNDFNTLYNDRDLRSRLIRETNINELFEKCPLFKDGSNILNAIAVCNYGITIDNIFTSIDYNHKKYQTNKLIVDDICKLLVANKLFKFMRLNKESINILLEKIPQLNDGKCLLIIMRLYKFQLYIGMLFSKLNHDNEGFWDFKTIMPPKYKKRRIKQPVQIKGTNNNNTYAKWSVKLF